MSRTTSNFLTVMMNCGADDHSVEELREVSNWRF